MNKQISFYSNPFPNVKSYYDMITVAEEYGLSAVELLNTFELKTPDFDTAKSLKEFADSKGIKICCMSLFINLAGENSKEKIEEVKKYVEIAKIFESPYLHHTVVSECRNPQNVLPFKNELFDKAIKAVREIYDYSEQLGIKTIFEDQGYLINGVEGFGEFLNKVDRNVGVVADFGNIYQSKNDIIEFLNAFADRVNHVHIKDIILTDDNLNGNGFKTISGKYMNDIEIGKGIIDFKRGIEMLKGVGYNGYYSLESGVNENNPQALKNLLSLVESWI